MIIRKTNIKNKNEFGDFELIPDKDWKISQSFIDYQSGLLVVIISDENEEHWKINGFGAREIPLKQYIIEIKTGKILNFEEWSKYFNYNVVETISNDVKYKLITTRFYEPERNSDGIKEKLIEIATNKTISTSDSIAFREKRKKNLLEAMYHEIEEEKQAKIDAMLTLNELYEKEKKVLKNNDILISYDNNECIFQLIYKRKKIILKRAKKKTNNT